MSLLKALFRPRADPSIVVVSGLPRSGTSMMARMLEAGGLPPLTDGLRAANEYSPLGYYELEWVKKLPEGDGPVHSSACSKRSTVTAPARHV